MIKRQLLKRCTDPGQYVNGLMRGLECIGSFNDGSKIVELYRIPGSRDFGVIFSNGLVQVHPHVWHKNRKLLPPSDNPFNTRIKTFKSDRIADISIVKILDSPEIRRVDLKKRTKRTVLLVKHSNRILLE